MLTITISRFEASKRANCRTGSASRFVAAAQSTDKPAKSTRSIRPRNLIASAGCLGVINNSLPKQETGD